MSKNGLFAACFPGQGSYETGIIDRLVEAEPDSKYVFEIVSKVGNRLLGVNLLSLVDDKETSLDDLLDTAPDLAQLAIYALSVATYQVINKNGHDAEVLVGLSFGEIAAMTCGGALTIEEGAEVVCARVSALADAEVTTGAMTAVLAESQIAESLCDLTQDANTTIAGRNLLDQTIVSGPLTSVEKVEQMAQVAGFRAIRLRSPYAFHSPLLTNVGARFLESLSAIEFKPLHTKVLSPNFNRFYTEEDDLRMALVDHLTQPFDFPTALDTVARMGIPTLVEFGGKEGLTKISRQYFGDTHIVSIPSLPPSPDTSRPLQLAIEHLEPTSNGELSMEIGQASFDEFWEDRSSHIMKMIREEFESFMSISDEPTAAYTDSISTKEPILPQTEVPMETVGSLKVGRGDIFSQLVSLYSEALEYPAEVFSEDVELEGDLGVDSVKQTELLARVGEKFELPPLPTDFRLGEFGTLGRVTDLVLESDAASTEVATSPTGDESNTGLGRDEVFSQLVSLYSEALEYPAEVFSEDVELEGDLGVDSVKQTELLARVGEKFELPPLPTDFRLGEFGTLGRVTDLVVA